MFALVLNKISQYSSLGLCFIFVFLFHYYYFYFTEQPPGVTVARVLRGVGLPRSHWLYANQRRDVCSVRAAPVV